MAYPTFSTIQTYCNSFGIDIPAQAIVEDYIDASVEEWHSAVGYEFHGATAGADYIYDSPANGDLITPHFTTIDEVSIDGRTLTVDVDYQEYHWGLRMLASGSKITITGDIGYDTLPTRVAQLIIKMTLWRILTQNPTKNIREIKLADQTVKMGDWFDFEAEFNDLHLRYRW